MYVVYPIYTKEQHLTSRLNTIVMRESWPSWARRDNSKTFCTATRTATLGTIAFTHNVTTAQINTQWTGITLRVRPDQRGNPECVYTRQTSPSTTHTELEVRCERDGAQWSRRGEVKDQNIIIRSKLGEGSCGVCVVQRARRWCRHSEVEKVNLERTFGATGATTRHCAMAEGVMEERLKVRFSCAHKRVEKRLRRKWFGVSGPFI